MQFKHPYLLATLAITTPLLLSPPLIHAQTSHNYLSSTQVSKVSSNDSSTPTQAQINQDEDFIYDFFASLNDIPSQTAYNQNREHAEKYVTNAWFFKHYFPPFNQLNPHHRPPVEKTLAKKIDIKPVKHQPHYYDVKITAAHYKGDYNGGKGARIQRYTLRCYLNSDTHKMNVKPVLTKN